MPTFCRHNRFLERCPICSKTLSGKSSGGARAARAKPGRRGSSGTSGGPASGQRRPGSQGLRVSREGRAEDDGYRSELLTGVRSSADAGRLAEEIAFSSGRLLALAAQPPSLYGEVRKLAAQDLERATWSCFLIAYLCPLEVSRPQDGDPGVSPRADASGVFRAQDEDPFAGIRSVLAACPRGEWVDGEAPDLHEVPLGPRSSHVPARGADTLIAYRQWVDRGGQAAGARASSGAGGHPVAGAQASAFMGDPSWSPKRRFERLFERLALPGFARMGRYELLVTLGRLGLYELCPESLQLGGARGVSSSDPSTLAAKRVFGIGDPLLLERRAATLAQAIAVPVEALELALANWASPQRATMGVAPGARDDGALERAQLALGL